MSMLKPLNSEAMKSIGRKTRNLLAFYGAISLATPLVAYTFMKKRDKELQIPPESLWIEIDFTKQLTDKGRKNPLQALLDDGQDLRVKDVVEALRRAQEDGRVRGVVGKFSDGGWQSMNLACAQEVRDALLQFRETCQDKKFTVAYTDSFGEAGQQGLGEYFLASGFQNLYVQPSGHVGMLGLSVQMAFFRETLDRYGIRPQFTTREEFKNAVDMFTNKGFSKSHRKATQSLLRGLLDDIKKGISASRGISESDLHKLMDEAPLRPKKAMEANLITGVKYSNEVLQEVVFPQVFQELLQIQKLVTKALEEQEDISKDKEAKDVNKQQESSEVKKSETRITFGQGDGSKMEANFEISQLEEIELQKGERGAEIPGSDALIKVDEGGKLTMTISMDDKKLDPKASMLQMKVFTKAVQSGSKDVKMTCLKQQRVTINEYLANRRKEEKKKRDEMLKIPITERLQRIISQENPETQQKDTIAVIHLNGEIERSTKKRIGEQDEKISSGKVVQILEKARSDPRVAGVVLRVNSPGGSALASDSISHAILELKRKAEIPVICSMSNYAASGGYMIAAACDQIIAQPTTITGSIGVIAGKLTFQRFLERYGVKFDKVQFGKNSTAMSLVEDFNAAQLKRLNQDVDEIYKDFVEKVAKGRNMEFSEVMKLAKGRVWTGRQALENGLVDRLGGLQQAVECCAEKSNVDLKDLKIRVVEYPPPLTMKEVLKKLIKGKSASDDNVSIAALVTPVLASYMKTILGADETLSEITRLTKNAHRAVHPNHGYEAKDYAFPEFK